MSCSTYSSQKSRELCSASRRFCGVLRPRMHMTARELGAVIHGSLHTMRGELWRGIARIDSRLARGTYDLSELVQDMLANAVVRTVVGEHAGTSIVIARALTDYIQHLKPAFAFVPESRHAMFGWRKFEHAYHELRRVIREALPESVLVRGGAEYWVDNFIALFFAAVDTTSNVLSGALAHGLQNSLEPSESLWRSYVRMYPPVPFVPRSVTHVAAGDHKEPLYRFPSNPAIYLEPGNGVGFMVSNMLGDPRVPIGTAFGFSGRKCLGAALATDMLDYAVPALGWVLYNHGAELISRRDRTSRIRLRRSSPAGEQTHRSIARAILCRSRT